MRKFFGEISPGSLLSALREVRDKVGELADLPSRCRRLETDCRVLRRTLHDKTDENHMLRREIERLRSELDARSSVLAEVEACLASSRDRLAEIERVLEEERRRRRLAQARSSLLLTLQRLAILRERRNIQGSMAALVNELDELAKGAELARRLHEETLAELHQSRKRYEEEERRLRSRLLETEGEKKRSDEQCMLLERRREELAMRIGRLEEQYSALSGEVRRSIGHVIDKLVDKGLSSRAIEEIVPEVGNVLSRDEVLALERRIRRHNEEQEVLLGLQRLRNTPRPFSLSPDGTTAGGGTAAGGMASSPVKSLETQESPGDPQADIRHLSNDFSPGERAFLLQADFYERIFLE